MKYFENQFGDIIINNLIDERVIDELKILINEFSSKIIWLEVLQENSDVISNILKLGFNFHHTEKNVLTLVRSIKKEAFPYASHYIGVGGVVIHENKILTVIENFRDKTSKEIYKLPGGFLNKDEHIKDAAIREVYEETGIKTEFDYLFAIRHNHKSRYFNKSNIYFVVNLKPLSFEINIDKYEINKAVWMDINEFLDNKNILNFNKEIVKKAMEKKNKLKNIDKNCDYNKEFYEIYI
jgi:ADP-ribose pyrophosphatase YjhB (NUDIX family)